MKLKQMIYPIVFGANVSGRRYGGGRPRFRAVSWLLVVIAGISSPCSGASAIPFEKLYDYYFPKHGEFLNSHYRRGFDETLFGRPPSPGSERHPVYHAFRGDPAAFSAFVHHPDRDQSGEYSEAWANECLLLLLRNGDERFSRLLAREDKSTREAVGMVIDPKINWMKHKFPNTRALYSYRWVPLSQSEYRKRQQGTTLAAAVVVTPNEAIRLKTALAMDSRFKEVQVCTTGRKGKTPALIVAPQTLSRKDMADLRRLIQTRLHSVEPIVFE